MIRGLVPCSGPCAIQYSTAVGHGNSVAPILALPHLRRPYRSGGILVPVQRGELKRGWRGRPRRQGLGCKGLGRGVHLYGPIPWGLTHPGLKAPALSASMAPSMKIHLVDGTYELFRAYSAMPPMPAPDGRPAGAVRGLVQTLLALLRQEDVTHVGCAFDSVIESFRNGLFPGYKTGRGTPQDLLAQFPLAEEAAASLGLSVWPMDDMEADDALATGAARWADAPGVEQVVICSPDKDLTQMVTGQAVVCLDRRRSILMDEDGVLGKFGVGPSSIPDYLALVGDSADGIPGIPRWGARATPLVLRRYGHLEAIPEDGSRWDVEVRGAVGLAESLARHSQEAALYKELATLRLDAPVDDELGHLEWAGVPKERYKELCHRLGFEGIENLPHRWA